MVRAEKERAKAEKAAQKEAEKRRKDVSSCRCAFFSRCVLLLTSSTGATPRPKNRKRKG